MRTEDVVYEVTSRLAPVIGRTMATASVRGHCDKLGLGDSMEPDDLERLLELIEPALHVFVGRTPASDLLGQIRAALSTGSG